MYLLIRFFYFYFPPLVLYNHFFFVSSVSFINISLGRTRRRKPRLPKTGNAKGMMMKTTKRKRKMRRTGQGKLAQMMQEMKLQK